MRAVVVGLVWLFLPMMAAAMSYNGVALASTPFTPPDEFRWVPWLLLGLFVAANGALMRWLWRARWGEALGGALGLGSVLLVAGTILFVSMYPVQLSDVAWGSPTHWGLGWDDRGEEFLAYNAVSLLFVVCVASAIMVFHREGPALRKPLPARHRGMVYGVAFVAITTLIFFKPYEIPLLLIYALAALLLGGLLVALERYRWKALLIVGVNTALYVTAISPFLLTGAFSHGRIPSQRCRYVIVYPNWYNMALLQYVRAHQGHLPDARSLSDAFNLLHPDSDQPPPTICPGGMWRDRTPCPYYWNADIAGKYIDELRELPAPVAIISCPYHPRHAIDSAALVAAYDDPEAFYIKIRLWDTPRNP